jgi:hypothetical protein
MEDFSGAMEKELNIKNRLHQNRKPKSWQLLFVDDHGKMVSFPWINKLAVLILATLLGFMVSTLVLLVLYAGHETDRAELKAKLDQSERNVKELRNEMDILLAKLVLTESKIAADPDAVPVQEENHGAPPEKTPEKQEVSVKSPEEKAVPEQKETPPPPREKEPRVVLGVTDFKIGPEAGTADVLKISFVIRNINRAVRTASGYIFIVLKQDENDPNTWFSVPAVNLLDGHPQQIKEGQFFRISRFKTVKLRIRNQMAHHLLKTASVFVYDDQGDRIFEKNFPISDQLKKPDSPAKPAEAKTEPAD